MSFLCEAAWKKRKTSEGATSSSKAIDGVHLNDTDKENMMLQFTLDAFGSQDPFEIEACVIILVCVCAVLLCLCVRRMLTMIC